MPGGARSVVWRRIVLDEAQHIRTHTTHTAVACSLLQVRGAERSMV